MQLRAWAAYAASGRYRQLSTRAMKENVAQLPSVADVKRIRIPELDWSIENKPGKAASVAIYHAIGLRHGGRLDATGAREALLWYDEYVAEAKGAPGSHPNIDLLLRVVEEGLKATIEVERE